MDDKQKKIIAVDDSMENLTAIKSILKDIYEVYPTISALKMFNLLDHFIPDMILLDVEMPVMNGYEAAKKLKENEKFKEIPIIFLTAMDDPKSEMEGLNLGAIDYIHKPFVAPLLLRRIKTHLALMDYQTVLQKRNEVIENLLELKTNEVNLRKKAEIEAQNASQAKSNFLSHMNHEIRTPLNAIIGMLGIAKSSDDVKKIKKCLERADTASKHMLGIINNILDLSKIEENKFELSYVEFNIEKMLMGIINLVNARFEEKNQNFIVNLNVNVPPFIFCDEMRLTQVIVNLLTNASKFTPEKGTVVLSIEKTQETEDEASLKIEVTDNGIGISEEHQKKLLTSFFSEGNNTGGKFDVNGLGLTISKRIIDLMRGEILIKSKPDTGSKISFIINIKKGINHPKIKLSEKINKSEIRILVAADSEEMRAVIFNVINSYHLRCDAVGSGNETIDMINSNMQNPYNIFFIDWKLPDTNGINLTKKIRELAGDKAEVVLLSMSDWSGIEKEAVLAGVNHFIPKPVFPSNLLNAINDSIEEIPVNDSPMPESYIETGINYSKHTILVVEDIAINREILAAVLESTGILIDFAEDGKIAVSMFRNNPNKYSLIFMDVDMPEMDGYEATRAIRCMDFNRAKDIHIIAMTANVFREDIENCLAAGMDDHIGKPIEPDILFEKLKHYISYYIRSYDKNARGELKHGIEWSDDLILGNEKVDSQHYRIFELVSELVTACENGTDTVKLKETLDFMLDYTAGHFQDEEILEIQHNYPGYEEHKQMHIDFKNTVGELVQRFIQSGSSSELSNDVNKIIVRWLINHIHHEDRKVAEYIRSVSMGR